MSNQPFIQVKNISKKIKGTLVLNAIDLELEKGKIYGFQGKNGSGKTMLFRAVCGLIKPTSGEIIINGQKLGKDISFPPSVGIIIEYPGFLPNLTGFKNLKLLASIKNTIDDAAIKKSIEMVGLDPDDKRKYKKYSLGMKQRLGIAQAIMEDPDLVVLDEPTNALDENAVKLVNDILLNLRRHNKTILIANHSKEELNRLVDEKFTLEDGKVVKSEMMKEEAFV